MELKITGEKGARISKDFIGLFIEDINYAIDGGLYAQLIENGNFESVEAFGGKDKDYYVKQDGLYAWGVYPESSDTRLSIVQGSPVSVKNPHYLRVETIQKKSGFYNKAYDGIYMRNTKIFFGEYAAHPMGWMPMNSPEGNNLEGALAEAAFLCGMARNSDVVVMTCYAPLFARIGYAQWNPDLIWFDEKQAYRTPNYFVQQMFAMNLGDYNIGMERNDDGKIYCQVSYDMGKQELIIKVVNVSSKEQEIKFNFSENWKIWDGPIKETVLTGKHPEDTNFMEKEVIKPQEKEIALENGTYQVYPFSFSILRIMLDTKQ